MLNDGIAPESLHISRIRDGKYRINTLKYETIERVSAVVVIDITLPKMF